MQIFQQCLFRLTRIIFIFVVKMITVNQIEFTAFYEIFKRTQYDYMFRSSSDAIPFRTVLVTKKIGSVSYKFTEAETRHVFIVHNMFYFD